MARLREQARVIRWRGKWTLKYYDYLLDKPRRISCEALEVFTKSQREELVKEYRSREANDQHEARVKGGRLAYDTKMVLAVDKFLKNIEEREKVRQANPGTREGLSAGAAKELNTVAKSFRSWLISNGYDRLTTGEFDRATLTSYFNNLASTQTRNGNKKVIRSGATLNKYRSGLRSCLNFLDDARPALFPDFRSLSKALRPVHSEPSAPTAFDANELSTFFSVAVQREQANRTSLIKRHKKGRQNEVFRQRTPATAATPVSRLYLLVALTGCRLGEALNLKWKDCDLERGRITFRAHKTGRTRILPLTGAPEGEVAPRFLEVLKSWRKEDRKREYVLPHGELPQPILPKSGWRQTNKEAKLRRIGPQMLRQNFTSYAASLGVPSAVTALWQGHAPAVADRFYRAQVLDRKAGSKSIEAALGLANL